MTSGDETASFTAGVLRQHRSLGRSGPRRAGPPLPRMWLGQPYEDLTIGSYSIRLTGTFTPDLSGPWRLGLESRRSLGVAPRRRDRRRQLRPAPRRRLLRRGKHAGTGRTHLEGGRPYALQVDIWPRSTRSALMGVRIAAGRPDAEDEFERAVAAARAADVAVVVVGSNSQWESEGRDRPDLSLPGRQRELVEAVIEANPRTVVVVNAGSPVEMPWAARAGAVLLPWYGGEEARRRPGRHHRGGSRAERPAAHHPPGPGGGRADRGRSGALSGGRRARCL